MPSLDILNHPVSLILVLLLSLVSSVYCWIGFREKDVVNLLLGVGLAVPTFDIGDYRLWLAGIGLCGFALWLKGKFESF